MQLIILRHGKAEDHARIGGDRERALLEKGFEQARRAGRLSKESGFLPDIVLTSPLVRTRETAEAFCEAAGIPGPVIQGWLACGMSPETAFSELRGFSEFKRIAIVGHEPDLSSLIEWLLGANGGSVEMKKGTLACVEIIPPRTRGRLLYLIPPKLAD